MSRTPKGRSGKKRDARGGRETGPRKDPPAKGRGRGGDVPFSGKPRTWKPKKPDRSVAIPSPTGEIRLNRYLAMSGICSRREADELITAGVVQINGTIVTELGTKVKPGDVVHYGGNKLNPEKLQYVLLNKPKDFITTTDDPQDRRTVMNLIAKACKERVYPVGRLDRHTTGVLLFTNDGDLAKRLTHPSHGAEKLYHITLDQNVKVEHLQQMLEGVDLEDGPARALEASFVKGGDKRQIGIKISMGRNRIVRRMFEHFEYSVTKLDRVVFAGLTKKDIERGRWRMLTEAEVSFLKRRG